MREAPVPGASQRAMYGAKRPKPIEKVVSEGLKSLEVLNPGGVRTGA